MMNGCVYQQQQQQQKEEALEMVKGVVCPKPRRLRLLNPSIKEEESINSTSSSPRRHYYSISIYQSESKGRTRTTELLDMILTKECYDDAEKGNNVVVPSTPPFFCGSPPSRASNPVVQDAQFGYGNPILSSPLPSSRKNGGSCGRGQFGQKHPAVTRVEGFNCRGISAVA